MNVGYMANEVDSSSELVPYASDQGSPRSTKLTASYRSQTRKSLNHNRVIKKRRYKSEQSRLESSLNRVIKPCCLRDPANPDADGPCLRCTRDLLRISRLPCLRYKVTDSHLYRTAFYHYPFFRKHLMVGPTFGDFHVSREWTPREVRVLDLAQDSNVVLRLAVREFVPSLEELTSDDTRGNKMYSIPWAIEDAKEATEEAHRYLSRCVKGYLEAILDDSNHLVYDIFDWAVRLSTFPEPNILLYDVLRLWVACRFLEGRWRCVGSNTFDTKKLSHYYAPPFINYQLAALITERVLEPLRITVLRRLENLMLANKKENWFTITLIVFILLHNYELQCGFHRDFARRRNFLVRFVEMPVICAIHAGAKTILAHFHYACKGQHPFSPDHNWNTDEAKRIAHLDDEKIAFLKEYRLRIQNEDQIQSVSRTDNYEKPYYFVGQMFDHDWEPRDTNEKLMPV
uniref:Uncharacterized protein n=1 Tax=Gibberella zeae TaxID=5518 RepID=A0A4E9EJY3_GIBZA